jgi:flagellar biosynthesis protein FliQ
MDIFTQTARDAIWLILLLSLLPLLASLIVALVVSLLQALTQIQDQTLTFVPKIIAIFIVLAVSSAWMMQTLVQFTNQIFDLMLTVGSAR